MVLDHIYGRPSVKFQRASILATLFVWSAYLAGGNRDGPSVFRRLSKLLSKRFSSWQIVVTTSLVVYAARRFDVLLGLSAPEPLAGMYKRSFFRATWVITALDAGYWSAMDIRNPWLKYTMSILLSAYYLAYADEAEEKVRRIRQTLTVEHMRVAWNKPLTPPLRQFLNLMRPRFMHHPPRQVRIHRPSESSYSEPISAWLYFDGPLSALKRHTKVVLDFHGGGFVSMSPRTHDDALMAWAGKTGLPVLSIDYKKAPEYPYPYALNECFDSYVSLCTSRGRCIGLSGAVVPEVILTGDSAGGNFATSVLLMILQAGEGKLPVPSGLVLVYPALDCNIGNWMTDEQMELIQDPRTRKINKGIVKRKSDTFDLLNPRSPKTPSSGLQPFTNYSDNIPPQAHGTPLPVPTDTAATSTAPISPSAPVRTRLATPSLITYTNDRILTPEMLRAMIILYIGPHARPDFSSDFLLSPVLAPDALLARFPKTYFLTGERDPLVDDTVIMAGRIRKAKLAHWTHLKESGLLSRDALRRGFDVREHVEVRLLEGVSHGFFHFLSVWPEGWRHILRVGRWFEECLAWAEYKRRREAKEFARNQQLQQRRRSSAVLPRKRRESTAGESAEEDAPLEMTAVRKNHTKTKNIAKTKKSQPSTSTTVNPSDTPFLDEDDDGWEGSEEAVESEFAKTHPSDDGLRRSSSNRSAVSLVASEEDILGRRMKGLVSGMTMSRKDDGV